tara:strand:+ start:1161 stop:1370 length:210 start_codon:yes stop_codon:yes gene_type:complete
MKIVSTRKTLPLKLKRIELGIKGYDLAAALGISPSELSLIENGRMQPHWHIKEKCAELLGVNFEDLWKD